MERVGYLDEVGRLVSRRHVDGASPDRRLVGHHSHRLASQMGQATDDGGTETRLDLDEPSVVDQALDHRADVIDAGGLPGDQLHQVVHRPEVGVDPLSTRRIRPGAAREERQPGSDQIKGTAIVVGHVVDQAAGHRYVWTTQFPSGDLLAEGRLHHRRSGGKNCSITSHHRVVRQRNH